ncbi:MAG: FG-GAP-like repeat-containing protein, partial [Chloroflexota bacterium]
STISVLNSNWNDNWLTYGTSIIASNPDLTYSADYYQRLPGEPVALTLFSHNQGDALQSVVTTIDVPGGLDYTPGNYRTPTQLNGVVPTETQKEDGTWQVVWTHNVDQTAADGIYQFIITATVGVTQTSGSLLSSEALSTGTDILGDTYASMQSLTISVGDDESVGRGDIVINEVMVSPTEGNEWIEVHNRGTEQINISGWMLTNYDAWSHTFPANTTLATNQYLKVELAEGDHLSKQEDQVGFYYQSNPTIDTIVDFVQWDDDNNLADETADDHAMAVGQWGLENVASPANDESLGRDRTSRDTNDARDWDATSGIDADDPTPESVNISDKTPPQAPTALTATPLTNRQIQVQWTLPTDPDRAGVKLVRSTTGYPTSVTDGALVYDGTNTGFLDASLANYTRYYYSLFTYDHANNINTQRVQTHALSAKRIYLAFEDLKNRGYNDWDMNDIVLMTETALHLDGSDQVTQVDGYYQLYARGGCYNHRLNLTVPISGTGTATIKRYDAAKNLQQTDTQVIDHSGTLVLFESSHAALESYADGCVVNTGGGQSIATAGASVEVSLTLDKPTANPFNTFAPPPFDPWLYIHTSQQDIHLVRMGQVGNTQEVQSGPLAGRDLPFAHEFSSRWEWPRETKAIWTAYPRYANYIISGGTTDQAWYDYADDSYIWLHWQLAQRKVVTKEPFQRAPSKRTLHKNATNWPQQTDGLLFSSPAVVDLDGDGQQEIIAGSQSGTLYVWQADGTALPNWPLNLGSPLRASPAIGDIDNDGQPEIVIGAEDSQLYAFKIDGSLVSGFPVQAGYKKIKGTATLADLDNDDDLEILVLAGNARLYIWHHDGTLLWSKTTHGVQDSFSSLMMASSPAVGDIDADGKLEIVVGSTDNQVYAWNVDGSPVAGWPQPTGDWVYPSPALADLNDDQVLDVVVGSGDGKLYAWTGTGRSLPGFPVQTGGALISSPAVADIDSDGQLEIAIGSLDGKLYLITADGGTKTGFPVETGGEIISSPALADISGDGQPDIIVGSKDNKLYGWHSDGTLVDGWPYVTDDWIVASPTISDVDEDGDIEVVIGSYDHLMYVWDLTTPYQAEAIPWGCFGQSASRQGIAPPPLPNEQIFLPLILRN